MTTTHKQNLKNTILDYTIHFQPHYDTTKYNPRHASAFAYQYYFTYHKAMQPQIIDGWLVNLSHNPLKLKNNSHITPMDTTFTTPVKTFSHIDNSCVWIQNTNNPPLSHTHQYYPHSAVTVVLDNGNTAIVDWSIGHFQNLENFLFVLNN